MKASWVYLAVEYSERFFCFCALVWHAVPSTPYAPPIVLKQCQGLLRLYFPPAMLAQSVLMAAAR
ncbi:MAG: hypothetical protein OXE94_01375 [Aestuariivita sp.]|nr:hypothetical protein [Aestuariivita sp.]MCY4202206.1 hypothetical protein [Aestuariivita sp.]MCY4289780.1 hypothetical protein [Aestuariivita sp.]MCY4347409.1 hypothetical protein [Aestuariivita sp.]